ncbi:PP0621 family protein [Robbsia sp. KACC 23696]|uniref:PP0621 family protein n=1 Tax=Robbsia sp. KACC 23696 TaxID=3149231 RepID=UPI00325B407D
MSRIVFWIVLFGAAWWFWRRAKAALLRQIVEAQNGAMSGAGMARGGAARSAGGAGAAPALTEPMVHCACCGAYSPRSTAVPMFRLYFCNDDHARRYADGERAPAA